jgi:phage terminase small subunit
MGVPKRLTEMQKRFAEYLVFGGPEGPLNKSEAAKLAGYSEKRCRQEGTELTNPKLSPLVVKYLDELKIEKMLKYGVTYESHITELARIKELALKKNSFSAAVNAETNRGKAGGLYIDRKIIKHGKLEDMTEEQLEMKMAQIEEDYASLLNDDAEVVEAIEFNESELSSSHKKSEKQNVPKSE